MDVLLVNVPFSNHAWRSLASLGTRVWQPQDKFANSSDGQGSWWAEMITKCRTSAWNCEAGLTNFLHALCSNFPWCGGAAVVTCTWRLACSCSIGTRDERWVGNYQHSTGNIVNSRSASHAQQRTRTTMYGRSACTPKMKPMTTDWSWRSKNFWDERAPWQEGRAGGQSNSTLATSSS